MKWAYAEDEANEDLLPDLYDLAAAARSDVPGGSTEDPHKRLLLLWPAMGDDAIPGEAATALAAALAACTSVPDLRCDRQPR